MKYFCLLIFIFNLSSHAHAQAQIQENYNAEVINKCLEIYNQYVESVKNKARADVIADLQANKYSDYVGPSTYWTLGRTQRAAGKVPPSVGERVTYRWVSILTGGAFPLIHSALKTGLYITEKSGKALVNNVALPAINSIKKSQNLKGLDSYEKVVVLIEDLMRYEAHEIQLSPVFKEITKVKKVKERLLSQEDLYYILKQSFSKNIPCRNQKNLLPFEKVVKNLVNKNLEKAIKYDPKLSFASSDSLKIPPLSTTIQSEGEIDQCKVTSY